MPMIGLVVGEWCQSIRLETLIRWNLPGKTRKKP